MMYNTYISKRFLKAEFWILTLAFAITFLYVLNTLPDNTPDFFVPIRIIAVYAAALIALYVLLPNILKNRSKWFNAFLLIALLFPLTLIFNETRHPEQDAIPLEQNCFQRTVLLLAYWVLLCISFYFLVRTGILYLLSRKVPSDHKYKRYVKDWLVVAGIWSVSLLLLIIGKAEGAVIYGWSTMVPFAFVCYTYHFIFIFPKALRRKEPFIFYMLRLILFIAFTAPPLILLSILMVTDDEGGFAFVMVNAFWQVFVIGPAAWFVFKRQIKGNEEMYLLKQELNHKDASLWFLRSQINPHFLFNALNTIYGTAIQENAERTTAAVEKLSSMMRFMLHENLKPLISLSKETEYLRNYIDLQRLRIDTHSNIELRVDISSEENHAQIAPMLLIPFVENAFKHGVSFRHPSKIFIRLYCVVDELHFEVYNTKFIKEGSDPEKNSSGIGLNNVKERLSLLYPEKHKVSIRETSEDFHIQLTLQLS